MLGGARVRSNMRYNSRYYLASSYADTTDGIMQPFWKYEQERNYEIEKRRWSGRSECLASSQNVCTALYPYFGSGHEMCMLGVNTKQGTLPGPVRAAGIQFSYSLDEFDGGLAYALGYRIPLCHER